VLDVGGPADGTAPVWWQADSTTVGTIDDQPSIESPSFDGKSTDCTIACCASLRISTPRDIARAKSAASGIQPKRSRTGWRRSGVLRHNASFSLRRTVQDLADSSRLSFALLMVDGPRPRRLQPHRAVLFLRFISFEHTECKDLGAFLAREGIYS
jgi:hypothetical protein